MRFARCYSCMRTIEAPGKVCPHCGYDNTEGPKSQPPHALPCGTVLYGRYVLGKVLGEGGFGITYMAYNLALDQPVCIKEYFPAGAAMRSAAGLPRAGHVCGCGREKQRCLEAGRCTQPHLRG